MAINPDFQEYSDFASYFNAIDLSTLSPPALVEQLAYSEVFETMLRDFVSRDPTYDVLLESDPAVKVIEVQAYREQFLRQSFNDRAVQLLLAYATGTNLDHLGAFYGVYRQIVTPADNTKYPPVPAVYQLDDEFRRDIQLAPEAFSTAGAAGAYLFHTYRGSTGVQNAVVYNASSGLVKPGVVLVVIMVRQGADPVQTVKDVRTRLLRDDVKPLTDDVQIKVATPANFDINGALYVRGGPDGDLVLGQAKNRLLNYLALRKRVGALVPLSGAYANISGAYIEKVELTAPPADFQPGLLEYPNLVNFNLAINRIS